MVQPGSLKYNHEHVYTPLPKADQSGSSEQGTDGGGIGGECGTGGSGGVGGEGGSEGGKGGSNGEGGKGGGAGPAQKLSLPMDRPLAMLKLWSVQSGADHTLPFHPSPYESYMLSVQVPGGTACVAE